VVVVCGEALMDIIRKPDGTQHARPGGGPFNTARALARLDVPTAFLGHLSDDAFGHELAGLLEVDGVDLEYVTIGSEKTTTAVVDVDSRGVARFRFDIAGTSAPNLTREMVPEEFAVDVDAVHVGGLGLALEPVAGALVEVVDRERGRRLVMLDPNVRTGLGPEDEYRERLHQVIAASTVVKASDADLAWLYPDLDYELGAERILERGVAMVVVTLGADGAFAAHRDVRVQAAAPRVNVVDTIGAGDAFGAALLAWLHDHGRIAPDPTLDEADLRVALDYSCLAAAFTCSRAGADPPRKTDLVAT
jgi:fructokinase